MNPFNDIVCSLLQTPFCRRKDDDQKDVLVAGRPTPLLEICVTTENRKSGKIQNRQFKSAWYKNFTWLCGSWYLQKLFCWPCLLLSNKNNIWCTEGFSDLHNATRSFQKHADSVAHLKCRLQFKNFQKNRNTVADAGKENMRLYILHFNENVRLNRLFMQLVIDAVLYLIKQAFCEYNESITSINPGNFKELLALLTSRSSLEIQNHYATIKHVFNEDLETVQDEVLECISEHIRDYVKNEIRNTNFFSVQVNDSTDITRSPQCSILVRYVNSESILVERFLGFQNVDVDRTADALFNFLHGVLGEYSYTNKLVSHCYDGASVTSEHLDELQSKIKEKAPLAVLLHSLAYRLNLVLQQSFKKFSECRIFFAVINGMSSFLRHSEKGLSAVKLNPDSISENLASSLTNTRWPSKLILGVIVEEWDKLENLFQTIVNDEESDQVAVQLARSFLKEMSNFEFAFLAVVFNDVFESTEPLSDALQKASPNINFYIPEIESTCEIISNKRNEQFYTTVILKAKNFSQGREYPNMTEEEAFKNYKVLFYEILDKILMEIRTRFQDLHKLQFLCLVDTSKFEKYSENFPLDAFNSLQEFYPTIFTKAQRLKNELNLLYHDTQYRNVTTEEAFQILQENQDVFEEAYKFFCLVFTLPFTSVPVERSSSCSKRVKTDSRNAISQGKLESLANVATQKDLVCNLIKNQPFYEDVIDRFAALKNRRIDLTYER